jgi:hypothetical protein
MAWATTMELPFTRDQFVAVFAAYNRAFWPMVVAWWCATPVLLALVRRHPERWSHRLSWFLGGLWLWNAVAYHAILFTRINPAAWLFAALFTVQAAAFFRSGQQRRPVFLSSPGPRAGLGLALAAYALAYPFLTIALGHAYPAAPTFGLPCPTTILTIGVLVTARGPVPVGLSIVPIAWGVVGGSAAVLLDVPTDYALLASAGLLLAAVADRARR